MSDSDFLKGLIIGGLIGAVAGLLLAPKSGRETRADICNKTEELMKLAKEEYDKGIQKTSEVYHSVKDAAVSSIQGESGRLSQAVQAGVKAYNEAKQE
jgi:gas vesicle protein